jgi:hypothetical protein
MRACEEREASQRGGQRIKQSILVDAARIEERHAGLQRTDEEQRVQAGQRDAVVSHRSGLCGKAPSGCALSHVSVRDAQLSRFHHALGAHARVAQRAGRHQGVLFWSCLDRLELAAGSSQVSESRQHSSLFSLAGVGFVDAGQHAQALNLRLLVGRVGPPKSLGNELVRSYGLTPENSW